MLKDQECADQESEINGQDPAVTHVSRQGSGVCDSFLYAVLGGRHFPLAGKASHGARGVTDPLSDEIAPRCVFYSFLVCVSSCLPKS